MAQATKAHQQGQSDRAEDLYKAVLQSFPNHQDANHNLGLVLAPRGDFTAALPLFKKALQQAPNIHQLWISFVPTLIKDHQFEEAQ